MACIINDKEKNLSHALDFLENVKKGTDIACFPEFFNTGYNLDTIGDKFYDLAETIPGETTKIMGREARKNNLVVVGNIAEKDTLIKGILYNTTFIIGRDGELIGKYRKFYLYPKEYCYFRQGDEIPVFDTDVVKVGTAICFDHAFPELFRTLALRGAEIVLIPSAVPVGYEYLLNLRTRARAQDNQYFVASINRVGSDSDCNYCGLSKIVNPRGEVLAEASLDKEEIIESEIDTSEILNERMQEPVLRSIRRNSM